MRTWHDMTEDEKRIALTFIEHHLNFWKDDPNAYQYIQIKVIGGREGDVKRVVNSISKCLEISEQSKLHKCSLEIDPEVRVAKQRETRCYRQYLKVYLPRQDPMEVYEETIAALKSEIRDLEMQCANLYSRLEAMKTHRTIL
ncbi:hypothetical protein NG798_00560 [Ancylothrix sp. C2]|uniref:hypothetical protein n=1 Tax=Ancylothrix sp. D3o TaxID=2953691 RepID=UPI0021BB7676|nr:hypothetical protein [Ancylothrix sp. D3o]MCT7948284.1 hypothetical protein [Ancylothrix sp. D3o]